MNIVAAELESKPRAQAGDITAKVEDGIVTSNGFVNPYP
jgi:hypothetical protein